MSYDLRIWEQPVDRQLPGTLREVGKLLEDLEVLRPGPNPRFTALARKLAEQYPRDEWVGSLVEEARIGNEAVFAFSLPDDGRLRVMRSVVETANEEGLTVLDDQLGIVFFPGGTVVPRDRAALWQSLKQELDSLPVAWSKARARKALATLLAATLAKHGFKIMPPKQRPKLLATCDAPFIRDVEEGRQRVCVWLSGSGGELRCELHVTASHHAVEEIWNRIYGEDWPRWSSDSIFFNLLGMLEGAEQKLPLNEEDDVFKLGDFIEAKVIPILEQCRTVSDTHNMLWSDRCPSSLRPALGPPARLMIARLAGNPEFDAMVEQYRGWSAKDLPDHAEKMRQLIEYLNGIQPL